MDTAFHCPPALASDLERARRALHESGVPVETLARSASAAGSVGALTDEATLALGTLGYGALAPGGDAAALTRIVGERAAHFTRALAALGDLGLPKSWQPASGLDARQAETLRKMLLAVVSDPRLVLARLAIQLVELRAARDLRPDEQERLATGTREIFAPLANRLGVWLLNWELVDLASRLL